MKGELKERWQSLLASQGLTGPDGRPLYAYRFARIEFERIGAMLQRHGISVLNDLYGAGLVVSHVAEWFRRERSGGHWDWIRPLRAIGLDYGPSARIRYSDIESLVDDGLRIWRRPKPAGGERLLAIVREAGFPVASIREDPRISSWLKNAVLAAERGLPVRDSVDAEAWRVSDRLAQALIEPASVLCEKMVELRALLTANSGVDPVEALDKTRSNWRSELPFDMEAGDIRAMVEQIVRIRDEATTALSVNRYLSMAGKAWQPRASLSLAGRVDSQRLPPSIVAAVKSGRRTRIATLPPFCDQPVTVAAVETYEKDGGEVHELRALVTDFDAPLSLDGDAKLAVLVGSGIDSEFIAPGGEALDGPIIAMHVGQLSGSGTPTILEVIGTSPVKTRRSILALAVRHEAFDAVSFSDGHTDLGDCPTSGRRIVCFSGEATYDCAGTLWKWRTAIEGAATGRTILVGSLLRNSHESIYRGLPEVWIERDGLLSQASRHQLYWRPKGSGSWRCLKGTKPWGRIDIAVMSDGDLQFNTTASVVPPAFDVTFDRCARSMCVAGSDTLHIAARGVSDLITRREGDSLIVNLGPASSSPKITLRLHWEAALELSFTDPSFELRLLDASDSPLPMRSTFAVDDLKGIRICATHKIPLTLELRANDTASIGVNRVISGDIPLSAFANSVKQLLGSSGSLDARVDITAMGGTERIAEVRWYEQDVDPFSAPRNVAFSALAPVYGYDLRGISLIQPSLGSIRVNAPASQSSMREELSRSLPYGPWLIYGRRSSGPRVRPRIVPALIGASPRRQTELEEAIARSDPTERATALRDIYSHPSKLLHDDIRRLIELLVLARREELPIASIDTLRFLSHSPGVAMLLLAECESFDERVALMDIQRGLPFLWCSTSIEDWLASFKKRVCHTREVSAEFGIDASIAYKRAIAALSEIVGLRPELSTHANAVLIAVIAAEMAQDGEPVDGAFARFPRIDHYDGIRREIDRMVSRHEDIGPPPRDILTAQHREQHRDRWVSYDRSLMDVISVPFALANHACGREHLTGGELKRCRDVWLYDSEYFEAIIPICLHVVLQSTGNVRRGRM